MSHKHKRELFIASRNSNDSDLINYYKKYCKTLCAVIKEAKKLNYADKIKKSLNRSKTIRDIVNLETNKTDNIERIDNLYLDGNTISDCHEIANALNKYFLNITKSINSKQNEPISHNLEKITPLYCLTQSFKNPFPYINLKFISTREIENIIKSLKPKNSSGYDGISTKLITICSPFISSPLAHICNKSLSSGIFPDRLKYAIVKPLFKKGDKSKISIVEYRETNLMSLASLFLYLMLNMFRMLIHPSSGACDLSVELFRGLH